MCRGYTIDFQVVTIRTPHYVCTQTNETRNAKRTHTTSKKRPIALVSDLEIQSRESSGVTHFIMVGRSTKIPTLRFGTF